MEIDAIVNTTNEGMIGYNGVAFAIALQLDLDKTQDLLASAGLTLSKSFFLIRYPMGRIFYYSVRH